MGKDVKGSYRIQFRASAHECFELPRFLCRFDETCCFKWKRAHRRLLPSLRRFSRRNVLHFLGGPVAAQPLAAAVQPERTYLLARTNDKITARLPGTGTLITVFVGNTWCFDEQQPAETAAAHSVISKELFRTRTQVFV
jgi:hypothetical protein